MPYRPYKPTFGGWSGRARLDYLANQRARVQAAHAMRRATPGIFKQRWPRAPVATRGFYGPSRRRHVSYYAVY